MPHKAHLSTCLQGTELGQDERHALVFALGSLGILLHGLRENALETNIFFKISTKPLSVFNANPGPPHLAELDGLVHGHLPLQQLLHHVRLAQLLQDQKTSPGKQIFYSRFKQIRCETNPAAAPGAVLGVVGLDGHLWEQPGRQGVHLQVLPQLRVVLLEQGFRISSMNQFVFVFFL